MHPLVRIMLIFCVIGKKKRSTFLAKNETIETRNGTIKNSIRNDKEERKIEERLGRSILSSIGG
jgi:hypothetical protein